MSRNQIKGFTLTEMMMTLLMAGVLLSFAIPSFNEFTRSQRVSNETNSIVSDLTYARVVALNTGLDAIIEPMDPADWSAGWRIFLDKDGNGTYAEASDDLLRVKQEVSNGLEVTGPAFIGFTNQGALYDSIVPLEIRVQHEVVTNPKVITVAISGIINTKSGS